MPNQIDYTGFLGTVLTKEGFTLAECGHVLSLKRRGCVVKTWPEQKVTVATIKRYAQEVLTKK